MFKVVPDQLRISDGWVRCGQCAVVFEAPEHLQPDPVMPASPVAAPFDAVTEPDPIPVHAPEPVFEPGAAPVGVDPEAIGRAVARVPKVVQVHDLHVWEVTSGFVSLSAHVLVDQDSDCHGIRQEIEALLLDRFGIEHTTLQTDHVRSQELLSIERSVEGLSGS